MRSNILTDKPQDIALKLCEEVEGSEQYNPGAANVIGQALTHQASFAEGMDGGLAAMTSLLALDMAEIYGSKIWILFKDVCDQDMDLFLATLFAPSIDKKEVAKALTEEHSDDKEELKKFLLGDGENPSAIEKAREYAKTMAQTQQQ